MWCLTYTQRSTTIVAFSHSYLHAGCPGKLPCACLNLHTEKCHDRNILALVPACRLPKKAFEFYTENLMKGLRPRKYRDRYASIFFKAHKHLIVYQILVTCRRDEGFVLYPMHVAHKIVTTERHCVCLCPHPQGNV